MRQASFALWPLLGVFVGTAIAHAAPAVVPMGDNERVVHVVGTPFQHSYYGHLLETHLLLRFAHRGLIFRRVVVANQHLESFAAGMDERILVHRPTLVVIQAGFDDLLARAQSAYAPKLNFAWYSKGLEAIVARLRAAGVKVVVCSVPPWDNGSTRDRLIFPMDGMKGMVDAARQIAARHNVPFADIFTEAIGWPGIGNNAQCKYHYSPAEHQRFWQLLLSQVDFAFAGSVAQIDAKTLRTAADGAVIEGLKVNDGAISFTLRNAAGAGPAILKLTGLSPRPHAITVAGKKLTASTADCLSAGIDLGPHLKTKAGTKEFLDELARGHAAVAALPEIQDYRLPAWAKLTDFEQQKAATVRKAMAAIAEHDAAVRTMAAPEPLVVMVDN